MTTKEHIKLSAESGVSLRTVIKWDKGGKVTRAIDRLLTIDAMRLGLERETKG